MASTKHEYYTTATGRLNPIIYGANWHSMSFIVGTVGTNEIHEITKVVLKLLRYGSDTGNFNVGIYAVDGDLKPTGSALSSGSISGGSISDASPTNYDITMSAYDLQASTQYAIVMSYPSGDATHYIFTYGDDIGTYNGNGNYAYSLNSGSSWTIGGSANDIQFEEWGEAGSSVTFLHKVQGVANADINKINGVLLTDISKVNGVS